MIQEHYAGRAGRYVARCDRCLLSSPVFDAPDEAAAGDELRRLGWTTPRYAPNLPEQSVCQVCSAAPAREAKARTRKSRR